MQVFTVTGLFADQHNTKLHGTITGVILVKIKAMVSIVKCIYCKLWNCKVH